MYYESGAKYFWISFVTALIVSSIMSFIFIIFLSPYITQKKTRVEVPNVKGMREDQASLVLKNKGLLILVSGKKEEPNYEDGIILDQEPLPGFSIEKGGLVKVTVNEKSPVEIANKTIPDVRGRQLLDAEDRIETSGYVVGKIESKESDTYGKNQVINTNPAPGTKSEIGTIVDILVSTGVKETTVPDLSRKSISNARVLLKKYGLKLGRISTTTNIELPFDIIVSQRPRKGTKVKSGSSVNIVVNRESNY